MLKLVPYPVNITFEEDSIGFDIKSGAIISNLKVCEDFVAFSKKFFGIDLLSGNTGKKSSAIILTLNDSLNHSEGYLLSCRDGKVNITAKTEKGLFWGLQTLKQLLILHDGKSPCVDISDFPRFEYRGFLLDCGRYFFKKEDVKRIVDLMAFHKLNVLHWHLTEDQGWRIETEKYPLLTQKGSCRSHTNFNRTPHSGYYRKEDIKEIVKYCHSKYITVIPEFDVPGHSVAAISCYPYLSCFERNLDVATHWGVKHDILCAGKKSTYDFVYGVLDELLELFPDKIVHIGGDEAVKTRWKLCPHCQAEIKRLGLKDEDELQVHFMNKIYEYLNSKGAKCIMWGSGKGKYDGEINESISWTVWEGGGKDELQNAAKRQRRLINASSFPFYLDFPYGWNSLKDVADFDCSLTENDADLLGLEGCMWTEYVPNMKKLEFLTFPRLGAIADHAWAEKGSVNFNCFSQKLDGYCKLLDAYSVGYASPHKACPSFIYKKASSLWFNRRVFHWQGLHNLIDNKKVERIAK